MLDRRDLMMVEAIAQHGTFARAARALNMGQPALTRAVAEIEHRLQGPVFERSRHGAALTDLGRVVLAEGAPILAQFRALNERLAEARAGQAETLRVASGGYATETVGLAACAAMLATHRQLRIVLSTMNWIDVLRAVRARDAMLGIMELSGLGDLHDMTVTPLSAHPGVFAVRPGHPLLSNPAPDFADILAYPFVFIGRSPDRVLRPFLEARATARSRAPMHPAFPAVIHESPSAALAMLAGSDAVVPVTAPMLRPALRAGMVSVVRWRAPWVTTNFGAVHLRDGRLPDAAQAFITMLKQCDAEAAADGACLLAELGLDAGPVPACAAPRARVAMMAPGAEEAEGSAEIAAVEGALQN